MSFNPDGYFWIWPDRDLIYRIRGGHWENRRAGGRGWQRVEMTQQDYELVREISEEDAAAAIGRKSVPK